MIAVEPPHDQIGIFSDVCVVVIGISTDVFRISALQIFFYLLLHLSDEFRSFLLREVTKFTIYVRGYFTLSFS